MTLPQIIYWGRWIGLGLSGPWPPAGPRIYSQRIRLGLLDPSCHEGRGDV